MHCLEVAVNGERHCLAGSEHIPMLSVSVAHGGPEDATDHDETTLTVRGLSGDFDSDFYWGKERLTLTVGDIVTIRVVDAPAADNPIPIPLPPELVRYREFRKKYGQLQTNKERRAALRGWLAQVPSVIEERQRVTRSLMFWSLMVVLGLVMWFFAR